MHILGIDFTSRPSRRKPLTCLHAEMEDRVLRAKNVGEWTNFEGLETALAATGPWVAGIDLPFGLPRRFIETIDWPDDWAGYVMHAHGLGREGFRNALDNYRSGRESGDKEHRRKTDVLAGAISPQKLYGVPVGLMFFEGAPRLIRSGVSIPLLQKGDPKRVVVEAYPGFLARRLIGRRSYKNDAKRKQTPALHEARLDILNTLRSGCAARDYGFEIEAPDSLCDDPSGDRLDALLCAVQAAWAWGQRNNGFGAPDDADPLEGWIADPLLKPVTEIPVLSWTIEADMIRTVRNISLKKAIDLVIIRYLRGGDTRALAWWLHEGHCPSPDTLKYVACMLQPGSGATTKDFPFELILKSRAPRRGRPKKGPEANLRDWLIYKDVAERMDEIGPGSYESAIKEIASYDGLEVATVKRAYDNMSAVVSACTSDHED